MGEETLSIDPGTWIMVISGKYKGCSGHVVRCTSQRAWIKLFSLKENPTVCLAKKSFVIASQPCVSSDEVPCLATENNAKQPLKIPPSQPTMPKLSVGAFVLVMEGQYQGKFGIIVKDTPNMAYTQIDGLDNPVLISKNKMEVVTSSPKEKVPFISPPCSKKCTASGEDLVPPSELRPRKITFGEAGFEEDDKSEKYGINLKRVGNFIASGIGIIAILLAVFYGNQTGDRSWDNRRETMLKTWLKATSGNHLCDLILPPYTTDTYLTKKIVGQDRAVQAISDALDAWQFVYNQHTRPLIMLFAGSSQTQKLEAGKHVANLVFSHCPDKNWILMKTGKVPDGLLILQGRTFSKNLGREDLQRRIVDHVRDRGKFGSVVLINEVEKIDRSLFKQLYEALNRPKAVLSYGRSDTNNQIQTSCSKVIFIFTTNIGQKSIRAVKKLGEIPKVSLDLAIEEEFAAEVGIHDMTKSYFTVVPFSEQEYADIGENFKVL